MASTPLTPGEKERRRAERALYQFERSYGMLDELERAAFVHGWRAGDHGRSLEEVVAELEPDHPAFEKALLAITQGHHGGYSAFLREEPDYEELRRRLSTGGLKAVLDEEEAPERGLLGAVISFFERHG